MKSNLKIILGGYVVALASSISLLGFDSPANAFQLFLGEDLTNASTTRPNSEAAQSSFLSALTTDVGTEDFEGFTAGDEGPLALSFPGAGLATLTGASGSRVMDSPLLGRFAISGSQYWMTEFGLGSSFAIDFAEEVAAFGFFGTDIGDFGAQLTLQIENSLTGFSENINIGNSEDAPDGSALYFGLISESSDEVFNRIVFSSTLPGAERFGFDDMTIASLQQVTPPQPKVPEPTSVIGLIFSSCLASLFFRGKR